MTSIKKPHQQHRKGGSKVQKQAEDYFTDSGYGGSTQDEQDKNIFVSLSSPPPNSDTAPTNFQSQANSLQQLHYADCRSRLLRAIANTRQLLEEMKAFNSTKWPVQYPPVNTNLPPTLSRSETTSAEPTRPNTFNRTMTMPSAPVRESTQPRLMTQQISKEFNVLKLDLKVGAMSPAIMVQSLEKSSISSLFEGLLDKSLRHLDSLNERISDTSSKVLVTGDLNAGKSTFCNALLRRQILPTDQQPCTEVFCEILDAREGNRNIEEVHAIKQGHRYEKHDNNSYDIHPLSELHEIVLQTELYSLLKVFVNDNRSIDTSLIRNGIVNISLIDAPGLNTDSMKTTAVFARQEEIDVVVFVVNAENHFTLSAKEFIWTAANEKAYIFIVVNKFDNIRDKKRCKRLILDQINALSPQTSANASELVHFVSAHTVKIDEDSNNANGENPTNETSFNDLEVSLRSFVLEKRARSKLEPAKTYLSNLVNDMETLISFNHNLAKEDASQVGSDLSNLGPDIEQQSTRRRDFSEKANNIILSHASKIFDRCRERLAFPIEDKALIPAPHYPGLLAAWEYALSTKDNYLKKLTDEVKECEDFAVEQINEAYKEIKALGADVPNLMDQELNREAIFKKKKDENMKKVDVKIDFMDFVDLDQQERIGALGISVGGMGVLISQYFGFKDILLHGMKTVNIVGVQNARQWIPYVLFMFGCGVSAFLIVDLPKAVPKKLSYKIREQLKRQDYIHKNSDRIASQCRRVLRLPIEQISDYFQTQLEEKIKTREVKEKQRIISSRAESFFKKIIGQTKDLLAAIHDLDLEGTSMTN